jgi:hypothetical protein
MYKVRNKMYALIAAFGATAIAAASLSACEASPLFCVTATNDHSNAVHLKLIDGDEDCLPEVIWVGMESYLGEGDDVPNFGKGSGAVLTPATLRNDFTLAVERGGYVPDNTNGLDELEASMHATGDFKAEHPDGNDLCEAETLQSSFERPLLAAVPVEDDPDTEADESLNSLPEEPAQTRSYTWEDFTVEISPAVQGTVFWATLTYELSIDGGGGCSGTYEAAGIWGDVLCPSEEVNECFCQPDENGDIGEPGTKDCKATAITADWEGKIACVNQVCVLEETSR